MDWSDNAWRIKWTKFYCNLFWINLMKKEYSKQQQNTRNSGFIALLTGFRTCRMECKSA